MQSFERLVQRLKLKRCCSKPSRTLQQMVEMGTGGRGFLLFGVRLGAPKHVNHVRSNFDHFPGRRF